MINELGGLVDQCRSELPGQRLYVARARTAGGEHVVIKIAVSQTAWQSDATLRHANGEGCVRLLAADLDRRLCCSSLWVPR